MRMASMRLRIVCIGPPEVWSPNVRPPVLGLGAASSGGCCTILKKVALGEVGAVCSKTKPHRSREMVGS